MALLPIFRMMASPITALAQDMTILVTGAAGFIGFHVTQALLQRGEVVIGIDDLNSYYDVGLKEQRLALVSQDRRFAFYRVDIADREAVSAIFSRHPPI